MDGQGAEEEGAQPDEGPGRREPTEGTPRAPEGEGHAAGNGLVINVSPAADEKEGAAQAGARDQQHDVGGGRPGGAPAQEARGLDQ